MDRPSHDNWFPALLTAGSFLTMILTWIFAFLDGLEGSLWYAPEFALGLACAISFVSLLATHDPLCRAVDVRNEGRR